MAENVSLTHVVRALEAVINEVEAIKSAVEDIAAGGSSTYEKGTVNRGIKTAECPPPDGTAGTEAA